MNATPEPVQSADLSVPLITLIDRYARTYHRWAKQPTNAELDAERKQLREQIVEIIDNAGRAVAEHLATFHAPELAALEVLRRAFAEHNAAELS